jgi:hypothetical protein
MGRSLLNRKGDWIRLISPPDTRRQQRQQLMEHRPALLILCVVSRLLWGPSLHDYSWALRHKRPPGPGTSLRITSLQDPASTATNGSRAAQSIKDSSGGLPRDHVLLDPAYTSTNGSIAVSGHRSQHYLSRRRPPGPGDYTCKRP